MVECMNCFKSLEYNEHGVATCEACGYTEKCDVRELLDVAGIPIECSGCMGGNRKQNYNVYYCSREGEHILRVHKKVIRLPWNEEGDDELRPRPAMAEKITIEVYKKDQFKNWHKALERPPERLAWPEPLKEIKL